MAQSGMGGMGGYIPPTFRTKFYWSAALTQNQWYDAWTGLACAAGAGTVKTNVRVISCSLNQTVANETLEVRVIADDVDETGARVATAATAYFVYPEGSAVQNVVFVVYTAGNSDSRAFSFEAKSLQIMYRKTTAAGANATVIKTLIEQW